MESLFISALKDYLTPATIFIGVLAYLYFQNKSRAKEAEEIKQFIDKRFKSVEKKFDEVSDEIKQLYEIYHRLETEQKEKYHELDKKILKQEKGFVEKVEFIALMNDTNRKFEELQKVFLQRDEKLREEIKKAIFIALETKTKAEVNKNDR